jgi:regulatory protein
MTLVSLDTDNSRAQGAVRVQCSDGSSIVISIDYLKRELFSEEDISEEKLELLRETGRELTSAEEDALRFAAVCYEAEKVALRLIARAEQNSFGLSAKLECRGFNARAVKTVISALLDRDLLDNGRFAERWVRSRVKSGKAVSPRWLLASLGKKGVDRKSSAGALERALDSETEYALLLKYLDKTGLNKNAGELRPRLKFDGFSPTVLDRYFNV